MKSDDKITSEGEHDDELDAAIVWLLHLHGPEAVKAAVARISRKKPGEQSKYIPTAMEEIDLQITKLLSSQTKIKIPTRNFIKNRAIVRLGLRNDGALDSGLKRYLKDRKDYIFARIDILGSSGDFPHIRFRDVLERYTSQKKLSEAERKFAQSRIACINAARDAFRQRFGALPADEWPLARIESETRLSLGALTLLTEQLEAEKSKSRSR